MTTPFRLPRLLLGLALAATVSMPAAAAVHCVSTASQLRTALTTSASSAEDDVIQLVRGNYALTESLYREVRGGLVLRGGYSAGCPALGRSLDATLTRIHGTPVQEPGLHLRMQNGSIEIDGLAFEDLHGVQITDGMPAAAASGQVLVRRSRFVGNAYGLNVVVNNHHVRIENSLFLSNNMPCCGSEVLNVGLAVRHVSELAPPISVDVLFNSVLGNPKGVVIQGGGPFTANPRLQNNIMHSNWPGGFTLKLDEVRVAATNNIWGSIETEDGGGFVSNLLNLAADPLLDANHVPTAGSPAINSGTGFVNGGLPATDHDGGPRQIGSLPDRGALESPVSDIGVITVTSTANSGEGTLRQAILDSNQTVNAELIRFNLGNAAGCPYVINLSSQLPAISSPLTIDGFSQAGSSPNTESTSDDSQRCVVLNGNLAYGLRLQPQADRQVKVSGLAFHGFSSAAIEVDGAGSAVIQGNGFGLGSPYLGNGFAGDAIVVKGAAGSLVGGDDPAHRNLIGRAAGAGIRLIDGSDRRVVRNFIGLGKNGYANAGNGIGIAIEGGSNDAVEDTHIGHSTAQAVRVDAGAGPSSAIRILRNRIGRSASRNPSAAGFNAGNGHNGVRITSGSGHEIAGNWIAHNGADGIVVLGGMLAQINANRVHENDGLGIDLSPDGRDPQDSDLQTANRGNLGQNYPVLETAVGSASVGTVTGYLPSSTGEFTIQLFASRDCDASDDGEGEAIIGAGHVSIAGAPFPLPGGGTILAPVDGSVPFSIDVASTFTNFSLVGSYITATAIRRKAGATLEHGATSEFSRCIPYQQGPQLFRDGFED